MRLDAHQHFWRFDPRLYPWIQGPLRSVLGRDHLPEHLAPALAKRGITATIAVQARQDEEETAWLLDLTCRHDWIVGVVGWVDLASASLAESLARHLGTRLVGVRHVVQDEPDPEFLLRPSILRGISTVGRAGLVYDVLVYERQLPVVREFLRRIPEQPLVLDHLGKPEVRRGDRAAFAAEIRELARADHLVCKVSGLVTEASWSDWTEEELRPWLDVVLEAFGPERLLFGTDWPVCTLAATHDQTVDLIERWLEPMGPAVRAAIFGENARRIYGLERS